MMDAHHDGSVDLGLDFRGDVHLAEQSEEVHAQTSSHGDHFSSYCDC